MTIGVAGNRVTFNCDGVTTLFPVPLQAYLAVDFTVILTAPVSAGGGQTTLMLNSAYSMATNSTDAPPKWALTTTGASPYATGYTLSVFVNPQQVQQTQYVQGQAFPSAAMQANIDRLTQMVQRLQDQVSRSVRAPDGDIAPGMLLPIAASRPLQYVATDASGNIVTTAALPGTSNTAASLGLALNPQTAAEIAAGATPTNYAYQVGNPWRYGADGTGGAADTTALATASLVLATATGVNTWRNGSPIAGFLRTAAEIAAGVVPLNFSYDTEPYDIRRYGAKADLTGVFDSTAALNTALLVATQTVQGQLGSAVSVPAGQFNLSSVVLLPNRVRVLGVNKRGSYFKAIAGWTVGNGVAAWSGVTNYVTGNFVTSGGNLYIAKQASLNQAPPNATYWNPISNAMFYAQNGYSGGNGNSMFDSTLENLTVDANNVTGLGCVLSSAWQEDCGLRGVLLIGCATYGVRYQDAFGGASLSKVVDTEIFGTTGVGIDLSTPMGGVGAFMLDVSNTSITGGALTNGISCNGNSLLCRSVHFETTGGGVLIDGTGWVSLDDVTGNATVTTLVVIAATFTGSLMMKNCRRLGSTNLLFDNRAGGLSTITGYDVPLLIQGSAIPNVQAGAAWSGGKFTVSGGVLTLVSSFNCSVVRNSAGNFTVTELKARPSTASGAPIANSAQITSGFTCGAQVAGAGSYTILTAVAGAATDPTSEVNFMNIRLQ